MTTPGDLADLADGWTLRFDCVAIEFTEHAVEAVNRRVFRMLDLEAAERKLNRLAAERGRVSSERPAWLHHRRSSRAAAWLVIDQPRMCFPLYGDAPSGSVLAGTCLTPEHAPTGAAVRWRDEPGGESHSSSSPPRSDKAGRFSTPVVPPPAPRGARRG